MALVRCCVVSSFKAGSWFVISGVVVVGLLTGRSVCVWIASVVGWLLAILRLYVVMYAGVLYLNVIYCGARRRPSARLRDYCLREIGASPSAVSGEVYERGASDMDAERLLAGSRQA